MCYNRFKIQLFAHGYEENIVEKALLEREDYSALSFVNQFGNISNLLFTSVIPIFYLLNFRLQTIEKQKICGWKFKVGTKE